MCRRKHGNMFTAMQADLTLLHYIGEALTRCHPMCATWIHKRAELLGSLLSHDT